MKDRADYSAIEDEVASSYADFARCLDDIWPKGGKAKAVKRHRRQRQRLTEEQWDQLEREEDSLWSIIQKLLDDEDPSSQAKAWLELSPAERDLVLQTLFRRRGDISQILVDASEDGRGAKVDERGYMKRRWAAEKVIELVAKHGRTYRVKKLKDIVAKCSGVQFSAVTREVTALRNMQKYKDAIPRE